MSSGSGRILRWFVFIFSALFIAFFTLRFLIKFRKKAQKKKAGSSVDGNFTVAFFHPYCNAGGGGERVLWCAIKYLQEKYKNVECFVYTGDIDAKPDEILAKARQRFGITFPRTVHFVYLKRRRLVEASLYPYFTLLGQSLGGLILGLEGLWSFVPDVFIDSMGYAFSMPLFRYLGQCTVACYVHYPTISLDMLRLVAERRQHFNNRSFIVNSRFITYGKLIYYHIFAKLYGLVGRASDIIMVNSSWTYDHIVHLWNKTQRTVVIYPPCDVDQLKSIPLKSEDLLKQSGEIRILSIGQFRPEKNHVMQLESLQKLKETVKNLSKNVQDSSNNDENASERVENDDQIMQIRNFQFKLILIGGCRDADDEARVAHLKNLAKKLGVENQIEWKLNISYEELKNEYGRALIGIHTMLNEHFGIGVVECMTAGLITIAHNSGGPKMDILATVSEDKENVVGFLAANPQEYAEKIRKISLLSMEEREKIRTSAKISCERFSNEAFREHFLDAFDNLLYNPCP